MSDVVILSPFMADSFVNMTDLLPGLYSLHAAGPLLLPPDVAGIENAVDVLLHGLQQAGVASAVVLNTCQRVEIYTDMADAATTRSIFMRAVGNAANDMMERTGMESMVHLMRVSCGLESSVLGEVEILGQVRRAHEDSINRSMCKGLVDRVFQRAISAGKRARAETGISQGAASLTATIQSLIRTSIPSVRTVTIIGAGMVGSRLARGGQFRAWGATVQIVNRTYHRARELADECGALALPWEELATAVQRSDAVVIALSGGMLAIDVSTELPQNTVVVDVSVPSVAMASRAEDQHRIHTLAQVEDVMRSAQEARKGEIPAVMQIIAEEEHEVVVWLERRTSYATVALQ